MSYSCSWGERKTLFLYNFLLHGYFILFCLTSHFIISDSLSPFPFLSLCLLFSSLFISSILFFFNPLPLLSFVYSRCWIWAAAGDRLGRWENKASLPLPRESPETWARPSLPMDFQITFADPSGPYPWPCWPFSLCASRWFLWWTPSEGSPASARRCLFAQRSCYQKNITIKLSMLFPSLSNRRICICAYVLCINVQISDCW